MIYNSVFFIFFKTIQQSFDTISFGKYGESIWFYFNKKTFPAVCFTKAAVFNILFNRAASVFTPFFIGAVSRIAAAAMFVFGA